MNSQQSTSQPRALKRLLCHEQSQTAHGTTAQLVFTHVSLADRGVFPYECTCGCTRPRVGACVGYFQFPSYDTADKHPCLHIFVNSENASGGKVHRSGIAALQGLHI